MSTHSYEAYLYLEGKRLPIASVSVQQSINEPPRASVTLPASEQAVYLQPGTRAIIMLKEQGGEIFPWFSGDVENEPTIGVGHNNKEIVLNLVSDFASLASIPIVPQSIAATGGGLTNGQTKLTTSSGAIIVPVVHDSIGAVQMWGPLINTKEKGTINPSKNEIEGDQGDGAASAKGKVFALLNTVLLSNTLTHEKVRRTRFLDRLAMYIDENAVQMIMNQGVNAVQFNNNVLYQLFQGSRTGWQVLTQYLGLFFHEIVPVLPYMTNMYDQCARGEMWLPPNGAAVVNQGQVSITMQDYCAVDRNVEGCMEMMIKPNMVGTFPPECNVITPDQYTFFTLNRNASATRMGITIPQSPSLSSVVLMPKELEAASWTAIRYTTDAQKVSDVAMARYSDTYVHRGVNYVTNEERIKNRISFINTQLPPMVQNTLASNITMEDNKKNEDVAEQFQNVIETAVASIEAFAMGATGAQSQEQIQSWLAQMLFNGGVAAMDAATIAKQVVSDAMSAIKAAIDEAKAEAQKVSNDIKALADVQLVSKLYHNKIETPSGAIANFKQNTSESIARNNVSLRNSRTDDIVTVWRQHCMSIFDFSRQGSMQVQGTFNLQPVVGFSIIFLDHETGRDTMGYLTGKMDALDFRNGAATTVYTVSNAHLVQEYDLNQPYQGSFRFKQLGIHQFSWGKTFDYSKYLYRRYLGTRAYVPLNHAMFISRPAANLLSNKIVGSADDELLDRNYSKRDEFYAHLGLAYKDNEILKPDSRIIELDIELMLTSNMAVTPIDWSGYLPDTATIRRFNRYLHERFYMLGDVLDIYFEQKYRGATLLRLLDSRNGNLNYVFDALDPSKNAPTAGWDASKELTASDKTYLALNIFKNLNGLKPGVSADVGIMAPRWMGNPGVAFSDLLLTYLSLFKDITYNMLWGEKGKDPPNEKTVRREYDKFIEEYKRFYGVIEEGDNDIYRSWVEQKDELSVAINKTIDAFVSSSSGAQFNGSQQPYAYFAAMAVSGNWTKEALREKVLQAISTQDAVSKITPPNSVVAAMADTIVTNIYAMKNQVIKTFNTWYSGSSKAYIEQCLNEVDCNCPPVPRPMSDQECIAFRQRIVNNVSKELSYYARTPNASKL